MYKSLMNAAGNNDETIDINNVVRYAIDCASDFVTDSYAIGREHTRITIEYQLLNFVGSGTLKLQHSRDGIIWYDIIDNVGSVVDLTITDTDPSGYFTIEAFPLGLHRVSYETIDTPTGHIQLLIEY